MDLVRIPQVLFILVVVFCLHARSFGNEKLRNLLRAKELKLSEIKEIPKNRKKGGVYCYILKSKAPDLPILEVLKVSLDQR